MVHHVQQDGNPFRLAPEEEIEKADHPRNMEFRVFSSNRENVFSTGCRYREFKSKYPGFNIYSEILQDLVLILIGDKPMDNPLFGELLSNPSMFHPVMTRSLLLVSDSQSRLIKTIHIGGDVIPVSDGGKKVDRGILWDKLWHQGNYSLLQRDREWHDLMQVLINEAAKRDKSSVFFCPSFDHPRANFDNPDHVAYIKQELLGTGVMCVDWGALGDPFLHSNDTSNYQLFKGKGKNQKEVHVDAEGQRVVRKALCAYLDGLRFIDYTENKQPLSVPKTVFTPPTTPPTPAPLIQAPHGSQEPSSPSYSAALPRSLVPSPSTALGRRTQAVIALVQ